MPVDVMIRPFTKELDFEKALVDLLPQHGWEAPVIMNPTEEDLIKNWAAIIFKNNRERDRLSDYPLTDSEMRQIIAKVDALSSPYEVNKFIQGDVNHDALCIRRDNPNDLLNCGKEVYLRLFNPREIHAGLSDYQIVRQPRFDTAHPLASTRRGDVMLLINGMPLIHIELKRSGVDVTQAVNQIKKYTHEGVFSRGIFSLVQIFVAMTPEKTLYFANPGKEENFEPSFYFHWADFNNNEVFDWKKVTSDLLSIPMAHQMVGYYTIADDKDETLKVLRSYQYYAVNKISDRVHSTNWDDHAHKGGFIWHTTGSGKTMTSFKAAQLIEKSGDADKVVFLLDRIELSTQSLDEYRGFAGENDSVQDSDNTADLVAKLESDDKDDCLIVTSIQKMSRINKASHIPQSTLDKIGRKRVVFIVDECHRGVYGAMLMNIKSTFPRAILFGFTGTPIFEENAHGELTTEVIFGDNLHKYTLANGIPDGNVLGFDLYREDTFQEADIREVYALHVLGVQTVEEIVSEEQKRVYDEIMHEMDILKIENEVKSLYTSEKHHRAVMQSIVEERPILSRNGKFHAILATKSIPEAIEYYELFKANYPEYNIATVFDDTIDNEGHAEYKEDAILEMLTDYNRRFGTAFQQSTYAKYKKDVAKRLAHKKPYTHLEKQKQLDLLIVVTQMLTGYDSKWVNTLYVDKIMKHVDIIQAFSRTNRLFGPEKPFGIIKFFTRPNQMKKNIDDALVLYVDQPLSVFVDKLESNLENINKEFHIIDQLFTAEGIEYYATLPQAEASRKKFAKEFCQMTKHLEAAKMQGFTWEQTEYEFRHTNGWVKLKMDFDEQTYNVLLQRYRELFEHRGGGDGGDNDVYELEPYITETGEGTIDAEYINSKFIKFVKNLYTAGPGSDLVKIALKELHSAFASLNQRDQRTAMLIIHDIQSGDLRLCANKTIYDYIKDYQKRECDQQVYSLAEATGLSLSKLKKIVAADVNEQNIDEQGRFTDLMDTLDKDKGLVFLKKVTGREVGRMFVLSKISSIIRRFVLDPTERDKIIFAYQNEDAFLDVNIPEVLPEPESIEDTPTENNELSLDEMKSNIRELVKHELRKIPNWPLTEDVINAFLKIQTIDTISNVDGVSLDIVKAIKELFGKRTVQFIDKHVNSGNLSVKFEVYLKKLYYMLHDQEIPAREGEDHVTLSNCIFAFPCLKSLRYGTSETEQTLSSYLQLIRNNRNTGDGNGAHASYLLNEQQLDNNIKAFITLYIYVTGMCYNELKEKYAL
ncbi:MAG: HsdR family type I site-specific deoxyribonuclease [Paludibacteraceae bacterium]|nr:HsdR family type I site-specific deoxyribonuclease [Paludibacteraceae bacterium]